MTNKPVFLNNEETSNLDKVTNLTKEKDLQIFVQKPEKSLNSEEIYQTLKMLNTLSEKIWLEVDFPNTNTYTDLSWEFWHGSTELSALCHCSGRRLLVVNDLEQLRKDTLLKFLDSHEKSNRLVSAFSPGVNFEIHINKPLLKLIEVEPTRLFLKSLSFSRKAKILVLQPIHQLLKKVSTLGKSWFLQSPTWLPVNLIYSFYSWLRNLYKYWKKTRKFVSDDTIKDESLLVNFDEKNALGLIGFNLIPPEQTNVYTGDKLDTKTYLVDRVADFYPFPKTICLVLTNRCNLKCVHCPFYSPKYVPYRSTNFFEGLRELDLEIVERLAKEAEKYSARFHIGTIEEPVLHPQLSAIIQTAKRFNTPVHVTTNGLLLKPKLSEEIIRAGLDSISFSIDAATQETYKAIRGGNFNALLKNIMEFIRLRNKYSPHLSVEVTMIMQDKAKNEWENFYAFWRSQGVNSIVQYQMYEGKEDGSFEIDKVVKSYHHPERLPCFHLWQNCFVYPDGEVSLCCATLNWIPRMDLNKLSVGNVKEMSLQEIWLSANYQKKRLSNIDQNWTEVPYCESCDMWTEYHPTIELVDKNTIKSSAENHSRYSFRNLL